jgi:hypothetical protein
VLGVLEMDGWLEYICCALLFDGRQTLSRAS